jgi:imidazolonepropionase-like amidohydrolase
MRIATTLRSTAALALLLPVVATAQTIAITGGTVYPVSGPKIDNGTVLITDGRITAVGRNVAIPAGAERIDATGKWVTPGLFHAATQAGLSEAGGPQFSGGYNDTRARGTDGVAASFRAWEGVNPRSTFLLPNLLGGVTTVGVLGNGGFISGQVGVLRLGGGTLDAMLVKGNAALVINWTPGAASAQSRGEFLARLREVLADAKAFASRRVAYENGATRAFATSRRELLALQPAVSGAMPVIVRVNRADDIRAALALGREFGLKLVIAEAAEAWMVADELAAAKVPVMVGAMNNIPESFDALGQRQEAAGLLRKAGVTVVLVTNGPGGPENYNLRSIRQEAGNAVAYGMTWDDALRAVTLSPAEVLGVSDRIGALSAGKEANVVVWSGDPFEFSTRAERVYLKGVLQQGTTRQDELTARYRAKVLRK